MKLRNLLWQTPLLFIILMPLWWGMAADFLTIHQVVTGHGTPENSLEMHKAVLQQYKNGRQDVLLHANKMYSMDNQRLIYMEDVVASLGDQEKPVEVKSGEGIYNTGQEILTILDDVQVIGKDFDIKTSVMRYLVKHHRLKSAADVLAVSRDMKISGTSFMYDLKSGDFRVGSRVHFEFL